MSNLKVFSRVLLDPISHFLVRRSIGRAVRRLVRQARVEKWENTAHPSASDGRVSGLVYHFLSCDELICM